MILVRFWCKAFNNIATQKFWESGVRNPGASLRYVHDALNTVSVYSFRPTQKTVGDKTWIEQMLVINSNLKKKYLALSGKNGIFMKGWREKVGDGSFVPSQYRMVGRRLRL